MVERLHFCQYRLERLRQAARLDNERRAFREFPVLVFKSGRERQDRSPQTIGGRIRKSLLGRDQSSTEPAQHLRNGAIDWLERLTKAGLQETRLSLDRARLLAQVRSTNVLLFWSAFVALLTAILVIRDIFR